MIYLLDVNALLALGVEEHEFHRRVNAWVKNTSAEIEFATCAITEIGFLRVLLQAYAESIGHGQKLLTALKSTSRVKFHFFADDQDGTQLPLWVKWPKQVTDGHLFALAKVNGSVLATLDESIPRAFVIPR